MVDTFFTEKRIIKKIIIAIVFVFMFNFTFSYLGNNVVFANEHKNGGKLLLPIHSFFIFLADAALEILQNSFYSQESVIQKAKSEDNSNFNSGALVLCVVAVVVCAVAVVYTAGTFVSIPAALATAATTTSGSAAVAVTAAVGGIAKGIARRNSCYGGFWYSC